MGARQTDFGNYKVNDSATKDAVEKYLLQAREYLVTAYIPEQQSITASYSDMPRSYTGMTSDHTGKLAARNVDEPERRRRHIERAESAISRLGAKQQKLIRARYLDEDNVLDLDVAADMGYSDRHYRRIKSETMFRIANTLGLVVLQEC
ncbi:ArpU family phage packaging/lysis transcriptional regulator [Paenibacillus sp. L3-i20]|uniref:ArpU family phage packaging/lysis transcriptional regulator n=1 Tax=Paenibacillus sp. L3-i20 TaxID=2905833 RepID=UPI001EDEDC31|nr:ArpU family phage packaging/lysis transcriptional regulator [Paenibacillus sp. L3-i20]GKU78558.1 hypothetical protein L3i20_v229550 [Paenibacillus sp. L3-i20]